MRSNLGVLWAIGCWLTLGDFLATVKAATVNLVAAKDNTIIAGPGSTDPTKQLSNGGSQFLFAGAANDGVVRRGLIAFDLSGVPSGSSVQSASLTLYFDRSADQGTQPVSLYRLTRDWGEGTSNGGGAGSGSGGGRGAPATKNDATWLYTFFNPASPSSSPQWSHPGAENDYVTTPTATVNVKGGQGKVTSYTWSGTGVVADVQFWVDHPDSDFGWLLKGNESMSRTVRRFESLQNSNNGSGGKIDARPVLAVTFAAVPEPCTFACAGGVLFLTRRR